MSSTTLALCFVVCKFWTPPSPSPVPNSNDVAAVAAVVAHLGRSDTDPDIETVEVFCPCDLRPAAAAGGGTRSFPFYLCLLEAVYRWKATRQSRSSSDQLFDASWFSCWSALHLSADAASAALPLKQQDKIKHHSKQTWRPTQPYSSSNRKPTPMVLLPSCTRKPASRVLACCWYCRQSPPFVEGNRERQERHGRVI